MVGGKMLAGLLFIGTVGESFLLARNEAANPLVTRRQSGAHHSTVMEPPSLDLESGGHGRRRRQRRRRQASMPEPVSTEQWAYFSKRPIRRGLALMRAGVSVLVARQRARRRDAKGREDGDELRKAAAEKLTDRLIRLGPTYVKLGQIVSSREELEGTVWADSMSRLQDNVPPFPTHEAMAAIERESGGAKIFESIDPVPLAAASLGQVHVAKLIEENSTVAVKIQRPGLLEIYETDAGVLRRLAKVCDALSRKKNKGGQLSWLELCEDSIDVLFRELDYRREADNGRTFAELFAPYKDWVRCPTVYDKYTTDRMLVMEYVPGVSLKKLDELDARGYDRATLAESLARAYLLQFCKFGFFNADPHAGNLAADSSGRLVIYDFGQVATLDEKQRKGVFDTIQAIIDLDATACVAAFEDMGVLKPDYDASAIVKVVQSNFDTGKVKTRATSKKDATSIDTAPEQATSPSSPSKKSNKSDNAVMEYFQLPASYAFVARALSQMNGVGQALDPDFEFIAAAAPLMPEVTGTKKYLEKQFSKQYRAVVDAFADFFRIPQGHAKQHRVASH